jgi:DNA mismatch endonuclease, patch repair protein
MADIVDAATRSRMMSGIRGTNTRPERHIRRLLHRQGFRFRLHVRDLPGKPDVVLPRFRAVLFVHGCFWHGHSCPLFRLPSTRPEFWKSKIDGNRNNDRHRCAALAASGWRVATVWECALRGPNALDDAALTRIVGRWLRGDATTLELPADRERKA